MNRLQFARQIQTLLRAITWADSAVLFAPGCVIATAGMWEESVKERRLPLALIRPGAVQIDPTMSERPDLMRIDFTITLVVATAGDQYGETTMIGANRTGGSKGRGLLEVEELVLAALAQLGPASGMPIVYRGASAAQPTYNEHLGYMLVCDYTYEALGTVSRTYQAPSGLVATGGSGSAALSWNASVRYDKRRFILRRASGSTPPATSSSGTGITLGGTPDGANVTSKTDTGLSAGTYSYSLFAVYDDTNASTDVATSAAQAVTVIVS